VILLAGFVCIMMLAAGCTNTSGTTPATTTAATPAATTAAAIPSVPATEATTAAAANTTAAPVTPLSWSGSWNTSYTSDNATVIEVLVINQTGSSVTGTYGKNSTGAIKAIVQEKTLAGTWSESDATGNYTGIFEFVRSADDKSFTGRWIDVSEKPDALSNTTQTWNGVRI
ncbi:hypothetical protein, partial [Methanoregula sp.]|uniref:hypothetical protein n=1 Tax=Methanoregula sp. TaxID=2052170 RepID=UPI00236F6B7B